MKQLSGGELEDVCWLTFEEARQTDLPGVTLNMIDHLEGRLTEDPDLRANGPVPYYFTRHGQRSRRDI